MDTSSPQQRVDTVERHYVPVKLLEKLSDRLFWVNVTLSLCILFLDNYPEFKSWFNIAFVITTLLYSLATLSLSLWVLPKAEGHRSTHLIADSLGVALDRETTNLYYNNNFQPSIKRLGANLFENSLFSSRVLEIMLVRERIKTFGFLLFWLVIVIYRNTSLDLISLGAQTLFASSLLNDYLRQEAARIRFKYIFDRLWDLFLYGAPKENTASGVILNLTNRYESTKSSLPVSLDSKIFKEINSEVTDEWEHIKSQLNIP